MPSKGFAEIVEIDSHTPHISAVELAEMQAAGKNLKILDSRTVEEFNRFHVPGAQTCPGAELVYRFNDLVPDPDTLVVVSCAGRTRSIIGAQSLINAGVPNKVVSLQGGTQGWRLAGLDLERNTQPERWRRSAPSGAAASAQHAAAVAANATGFAASTTRPSPPGSARRRRARPTCSTCARRKNSPPGHLPGSVSAPGRPTGAGDRTPLGRDARRTGMVLADDNGTRAVTNDRALAEADGLGRQRARPRLRTAPTLEQGPGARSAPPLLPAVAIVPVEAAAALMSAGAMAIALGSSAAFRAGHPAGAVMDHPRRVSTGLPVKIRDAARIVVFADDVAVARLIVPDLAELSSAEIAIAQGGDRRLARAAGYSVVATADDPPDGERIDFIFWNHDRPRHQRQARNRRWRTICNGSSTSPPRSRRTGSASSASARPEQAA